MTTPGASASHLRTELVHATLPRTPDAVCILAPGNNLTTSTTHELAGQEFGKLLISASQRWQNVSNLVDCVYFVQFLKCVNDVLQYSVHVFKWNVIVFQGFCRGFRSTPECRSRAAGAHEPGVSFCGQVHGYVSNRCLCYMLTLFVDICKYMNDLYIFIIS